MRLLLAAAIAVAAALPADAQDDRLKEAWPRLQEAWKSTTDFKATLKKAETPKSRPRDIPDDAIKIVGQLHLAFDAGGLWANEPGADVVALKQVFKMRCASFLKFHSGFQVPNSQEEYRRLTEEYQRAIQEWQWKMGGGGGAKTRPDPISEFEDGLVELAKLRARETPDDDLMQDAVAKIRKSMRDLGIMDDDMPGWLRVRLTAMVKALALGEALPEMAAPTDTQKKKVQSLIEVIDEGDIVGREDAVKELLRIGEPAIPQVRKRYLEVENAEVKARLKKVLGYRDPKPLTRYACRRCGTSAEDTSPPACMSCGTEMAPPK